MLTHHLIPLKDQETWDDLLKIVPHCAAHTHAYNAALAFSHPENVFLYAGIDEALGFHTLCPLKVRPIHNWADIVTPYGLSGFTSTSLYPNFASLWHDFCRQQQWISGYILQHPLLQSPDLFPFPGQRSFLFLDLKKPLDFLWNNFSASHRYEIRRALSHITLLTNETEADLQELRSAFLTLYPSTIARVQAHSLYHFSPESLKLFLTNPQNLVVGAKVNGDIVAVSLFLVHAKHADYFLSASTPKGRHFSKNLIWKACHALKDREVEWLNLGGGVYEGDSLEHFKVRFGTQVFRPQALQFIFDPNIYDDICAPINTSSSYFPKYRTV